MLICCFNWLTRMQVTNFRESDNRHNRMILQHWSLQHLLRDRSRNTWPIRSSVVTCWLLRENWRNLTIRSVQKWQIHRSVLSNLSIEKTLDTDRHLHSHSQWQRLFLSTSYSLTRTIIIKLSQNEFHLTSSFNRKMSYCENFSQAHSHIKL